MTTEDLEAHLCRIGLTIETTTGDNGKPYVVIRDYQILSGSLAGKTCDIAIERVGAVPYVFPTVIHTRPAMLPMGQRNTQASPVGGAWQYWSRVLRINPPTPQAIVAHIATIFDEV